MLHHYCGVLWGWSALRTEEQAAWWLPDKLLGPCATRKELAERMTLVIGCRCLVLFPPCSKGVVIFLFWQQDGWVSVLNSTHVSYTTSQTTSGSFEDFASAPFFFPKCSDYIRPIHLSCICCLVGGEVIENLTKSVLFDTEGLKACRLPLAEYKNDTEMPSVY